MKKVLLTKTQRIDRVPVPSGIVGSVVVDMVSNAGANDSKKNTTSVIVSSKKVTLPPSVRVIPMPTAVNTNAYKQRKFHQAVYEDIFKCLMRLPDKALQDRVIAAINGNSSNNTDKTALITNQSKLCSCEVSKADVIKYVNASTQTDISIKEYLDINKKEFPVKKENSSRTPSPTRSSKMTNQTNTSTPTPTPTPMPTPTSTTANGKKRGRKRNTCIPKVVKRSTAEMALREREDKQLTPVVTKKRKLDTTTSTSAISLTSIRSLTPNLLERRNSVFSDVSIGHINVEELSGNVAKYINADMSKTIRDTMARECWKADKKSNEGLLPIHDAILIDDVRGVERQVHVLKNFLNQDLNQLLTDADEDCIQLIMESECDPRIMKIILNGGMLPNHIYENSNTALHLAVINNIALESLTELLNVIDLNLILQINDDGYTALHIAIRHNQYKIAEVILSAIDIRESNVVYKRSEEALYDSQDDDVQKFSKYYEQCCDQLELNQEKLKRSRLKRDVINASEQRAGNPPLFFALEGEFEHLCYFLLAHLADPEEENLSGNSPKSFHYEYTRSIRVNLKVGRIMDRVTGILNTTQKSSNSNI